MTSLLFHDIFTTPTQVYLYDGITPTTLGNTFGTGWTNTATFPRNSVINFQGELYALVANGVYKKDDPTSMAGNWTQQVALSNANTSNRPYSGLHCLTINNKQYLAAIYYGTAGGFNWVRFDGTTWAQGTSGLTTTNGTVCYDSIVYQNKVYGAFGGYNTGSNTGFIVYDPAVDTICQIGFSIPDFRIGCFAIFKKRLYYFNGTSTSNLIYEITSGGATTAATFGLGGMGTLVHGFGGATLFTDGDYLICMHPYYVSSSTNNGVWCYYSSDAVNWTDISDPVVPAAYRASVIGGSWPSGTSSRYFRLCAVYDNDSTPGTTTVYIYLCYTFSAVTYTLYSWQGIGSVLSGIDSGDGDYRHAIPTGYPNNGERIWTAGDLDIKITGVTRLANSEQVSFIAYGGGTGHIMKLWYSLEENPVLQRATLANPVTGGTATLNTISNQVEGIAADGTTVYTVIWDYQTDSVSEGIKVTRIPEINT